VSEPQVSVIVPAKDQEAHLSDCLTSLVDQLPDPDALEVIVIDDGSRDATGDIAATFGARLPRLRVLRNDSPVGLASARNLGLAQAGGRYLAFLDGDDWLARGHLARMVSAISALDVDFVRTDHVQTTNGQRVVVRAPESRRHRVLDPRSSILPMTTSTMVDYCYAWAGIFDRRIAPLLTFPDGLFTAEDRSWAWRLHLQAASYAVVGGPGILYRRGVPTSLTQIHDRRQLDFLRAFDGVFDLVHDDREADRWWPKATRMFLGVLAHHLGRQQQMARSDRRDLAAGARLRLDRVPPGVLATCYRSSSPERQKLLAPLVRGRVGRAAA
jgi:hypothetical protein